MKKNIDDFFDILDQKKLVETNLINWKGKPDTSTPLSPENLNKTNEGIKNMIYDAIREYHKWINE